MISELIQSWTAPALIAFVVSSVLAIPILRLLVRLKSRQTVSQYVPEHAQKQGTPTMGGLIVVAGVSAAYLYEIISTRYFGTENLEFLIVFFGFALIGFLDDFLVPRLMPPKRGLGWKQKFGLELLLALAACLLGDLGKLGDLQVGVGVFLILFYSNAYNFVDGMDGMAGGVGIVMLLGLLVLHPVGGGNYAHAIVASLVPFLLLNAPPAKVFMGDIGSLPIGAAMGLMIAKVLMLTWEPSVPAGFRWDLALAIIVASVVMIISLVPVPLQILSVKLRKKRLFPMTPIHHAFQKKGIAETRIVWAYILGQFVCSSAAIMIASYGGYLNDTYKYLLQP